MTVLVYAEHNNHQLKAETHKLVNAAAKMGDEVHVLVAGSNCADVATEASQIEGVTQVLVADNAVYEHQLAENITAGQAAPGLDPGAAFRMACWPWAEMADSGR